MAKRRRGGIHGAARAAKHAPTHCKRELSSCMTGRGGRKKASGCMRQFNRCKR